MLYEEHPEDGTFTLDFGGEKISVRAPKFGGMKRLRAERDRMAIELGRKILALGPAPTAEQLLEEMYPEQAGDGEQPADIPEQTQAERSEFSLELAARQRAHQAKIDDLGLEMSVDFWKLILLGDASFQGLASPQPPADTDEWPGALFYDIKPLPHNPVTDPTLLDRVFTFWGKVL